VARQLCWHEKLRRRKKKRRKARAGKKLVLSVAEGFLPPNPLPFCPPDLSRRSFNAGGA